MLDKLLAFNPVSRLTVEQALAHPYLEVDIDEMTVMLMMMMMIQILQFKMLPRPTMIPPMSPLQKVLSNLRWAIVTYKSKFA